MRIADILQKQLGLRNTELLYTRFYEPLNTSRFLEEYRVFDTEHQISAVRIFTLLERLEKIFNDSRYLLQFEYREYKDLQNVHVIAVSQDRMELKINFDQSEMTAEEFYVWLEENFYKIGIFFGSEQSNYARSYIKGFFYECNTNSVYLSLDDPFPTLRVGIPFQIYVVKSWSEPEDIKLKLNRIKKPIQVILGHRKDGLKGYDGSLDGSWKLYGNVLRDFDGLDFSNVVEALKLDFDYDFSRFANHVRFGSAYAKMVNVRSKIEQFRAYEEYLYEYDVTASLEWSVIPLLWDEANIFWNSGTSIADKQRTRRLMLDLVDSFTPFERWIFVNQYITRTWTEFQAWLQGQITASQRYDEDNDEFLLTLLPEWFIENDSSQYFSYMVMMMGEFYDDTWVYMRAFGNIRETDINKNPEMSTRVLEVILNELGFYRDVNQDEASVRDFFADPSNIKKVATIFTRRILANLAFHYKKKGTTQNIQYLLNLFGIPRGVFDIVEYGALTKGGSVNMYLNEQSWFVKTPQDSTIVVGVNDTDVDPNTNTIEIIVNNFADFDGELIRFNGDNALYLDKSESFHRIRIQNDGTDVYSSSYSIRSNDAWSYIGVVNDNFVGNMYYAEQDFTGNGVMNLLSGSFVFTNNYGTFPTIELAPSGSIAMTEFRIFNKALDSFEASAHYNDFRSVAENNPDDPQLLTRFKFIAPNTTSSTTIEAQYGNFTASLQGLNSVNFTTDEFFNVSRVETLQSPDFGAEKIRIEDRVQYAPLSAHERTTENEFDALPNDPPLVGIYLSPANKINIDLIRKVSDFVSFVPDDMNVDYDYTFEDLEFSHRYLSKVEQHIRDLKPYQSLLSYFNRKIFDVIRDFIPASVTVEFGLMIKNTITRRNRYPSNSKKIHLNWNVESLISTIETVQASDQTVETQIIHPINEPAFDDRTRRIAFQLFTPSPTGVDRSFTMVPVIMESVAIATVEPLHRGDASLLQIPNDRVYLDPDVNENVSMVSYAIRRPSPWLRALIRGSRVGGPSADVTYFDNAGAAILVR